MQIYSLLAIQRERPESLAEALVDLEVFTEEQAREELDEYYRAIEAAQDPTPEADFLAVCQA